MPDNSQRKVLQRRDERGKFTGQFFFADEEPAKPAADSPQGRRDAEFLQEQAGASQPPVAGPGPVPELAEEAAGTAGSAAGAAVGGPVGGFAGGAAAVFLAQQAGKALERDTNRPVGSLEGNGNQADDTTQLLRSLLEVQQGIARVGAPIKDAVTTTAADSRI